MTPGKNDDAVRGREDSFLGELIPRVTEHLAERHAEGFDAAAGTARFKAWLGAHTKEPAASVETTGSDTGEPVLGKAEILDRLIEREKAARRERYRMLGAVVGFSALSLVILAVSPTFGIALVVAAIVMTGLVAATAVWVHSPRSSGSAGGDPLLDFARSIVHSPAADPGVTRYMKSGSPAQDSGGWPPAQHPHPGKTASGAARSGSASDPHESPGRRREVPFGPEISWRGNLRALDEESREMLESAYGTGSVYQQPAAGDYGYGDPGNRGGEATGGTARPPRQSGYKVPLTPADVRNKGFSTTRLRPGYNEEEVDAFLDEVEAELDRLIQENEELRAKLAEVLRGGRSAVPSLNSPLSDPKPEMMAPERMEPERRQPEPVMMGGMPSIEDNMDTAARVLSLAQQTADQAIADARREADETLGRARREADEVLTKARRQAEQITGDARATSREPGAGDAGAPGHWLTSPEREEPTRRG